MNCSDMPWSCLLSFLLTALSSAEPAECLPLRSQSSMRLQSPGNPWIPGWLSLSRPLIKVGPTLVVAFILWWSGNVRNGSLNVFTGVAFYSLSLEPKKSGSDWLEEWILVHSRILEMDSEGGRRRQGEYNFLGLDYSRSTKENSAEPVGGFACG